LSKFPFFNQFGFISQTINDQPYFGTVMVFFRAGLPSLDLIKMVILHWADAPLPIVATESSSPPLCAATALAFSAQLAALTLVGCNNNIETIAASGRNNLDIFIVSDTPD